MISDHEIDLADRGTIGVRVAMWLTGVGLEGG